MYTTHYCNIKCHASAFYDIIDNGHDVSCSTHHVMNKPRPSVQISYYKQQMRKAWERGYSFLVSQQQNENIETIKVGKAWYLMFWDFADHVMLM